MNDKEYPIPEEVAEHHVKYLSLNDIRDKYVMLPFGYKKARRLAIEAGEEKAKFWNKVFEIYPELKKHKTLAAKALGTAVEILDEGN